MALRRFGRAPFWVTEAEKNFSVYSQFCGFWKVEAPKIFPLCNKIPWKMSGFGVEKGASGIKF